MGADMLAAFPDVFTLTNLLYASVGILLGLFVGAVPGLGSNTAIGLLIPFTFYLDPIVAIASLLAIGKGGSFAGSIPAVLLNMPGTTQAAMTAIDGYKLTRRGKPKKALHAALLGSVFGDTFSDIVLLLAAAPLAALALSVGPAEYAAIIVFALTIVGSLLGTSPVKGLIAAILGLLLSIVGRDIFSAQLRFTFDQMQLRDGIPAVSLMLGLMVLPEIFTQIRARIGRDDPAMTMQALDPNEEGLTRREMRLLAPSLLRSAGIGTLIGAAPGLGATIGSLLSYNAAKSLVRTRDEDMALLHGVASAEAGNSAGTGANMIPLVTLGIPGNAEAALVLGAFMIHGMTPGPFLMQQQGPLVYAVIFCLILANILLLAYGFAFLYVARYILAVPMRCLLPLILVVTSIGTYAMSNSTFDVAVMYVFGILGLVLRRFGFPVVPVVVAFLLGQMLENGIRRSLSLSGGDPLIFVSSPISILFSTLTALALGAFIVKALRDRSRRSDASDVNSPPFQGGKQ